jgi:tetratricopeptide (TPR) repeat protein
MAKKPRVFVSFSSLDANRVRDIFGQLERQDVDVWDYSDESQAIRAGKILIREIRDKIDKSDYFIAIVSAHSVGIETCFYTRLEFEYAIERKYVEDGKMIPLILSPFEFRDLSAPFGTIKKMKYVKIDSADDRQIVQGISEICRVMNVRYNPLPEAHPRLPFWTLFREEVMRETHGNNAHARLMVILGEFNAAVRKEDWEKAYALISYFVHSCEYEMPAYKLYYPWIVKGVCEQKLNLADEAFESYGKATKNFPDLPMGYGGMGSVSFIKQDYEKSKEYYKQAMDRARYGDDNDERLNYAIALLMLGEGLPHDLADFLLNFDDAKLPVDERLRVVKAKVLYFFNMKEYDKACGLIKVCRGTGFTDTALLVYHHLCLLNLGLCEQARKVLEAALCGNGFEKQFDKKLIYYRLADYFLAIGDIAEACRIYETDLLTFPDAGRDLMLRYARILKCLGRENDLKRVCEDYLSYRYFPLPGRVADYYMDGFIQFLLGNTERALYDYERSGKYDKYYNQHEV